MDVELQTVPVSISSGDTALPVQSVPRLGESNERRTLVALGYGTFVAALEFVIPPLFFPPIARE
jgi:hypothetical protein